jgi:hypothetical protein
MWQWIKNDECNLKVQFLGFFYAVSINLKSNFEHQTHDSLNMLRLWKHIDGLNAQNSILFFKGERSLAKELGSHET